MDSQQLYVFTRSAINRILAALRRFRRDNKAFERRILERVNGLHGQVEDFFVGAVSEDIPPATIDGAGCVVPGRGKVKKRRFDTSETGTEKYCPLPDSRCEFDVENFSCSVLYAGEEVKAHRIYNSCGRFAVLNSPKPTRCVTALISGDVGDLLTFWFEAADGEVKTIEARAKCAIEVGQEYMAFCAGLNCEWVAICLGPKKCPNGLTVGDCVGEVQKNSDGEWVVTVDGMPDPIPVDCLPEDMSSFEPGDVPKKVIVTVLKDCRVAISCCAYADVEPPCLPGCWNLYSTLRELYRAADGGLGSPFVDVTGTGKQGGGTYTGPATASLPPQIWDIKVSYDKGTYCPGDVGKFTISICNNSGRDIVIANTPGGGGDTIGVLGGGFLTSFANMSNHQPPQNTILNGWGFNSPHPDIGLHPVSGTNVFVDGKTYDFCFDFVAFGCPFLPDEKILISIRINGAVELIAPDYTAASFGGQTQWDIRTFAKCCAV